MSRAFVFPGQASQAVGMGREVAEAFVVAKEIFEEIDEALKQNLSRLMFEGPDDELVLTENAQPAIMAVSLAVMRVLSEEGGIDPSQTAAFVGQHALSFFPARRRSPSAWAARWPRPLRWQKRFSRKSTRR